MILGPAQIVANTSDPEVAEARFRRRGYSLAFAATVPNHPAKVVLQAGRRTSLALRHMTSATTAPAVELTTYDGDTAGDASYALAEADGDILRLDVHTDDADASAAFWRHAGFRPHGDVLRFSGLHAAWRLDLRLVPGRRLRTTVDAEGVVLVTLLTTSAGDDLHDLAAGARRRTGVWDEDVGGRPLRVAMLEGPGGELVELIETPSGVAAS